MSKYWMRPETPRELAAAAGDFSASFVSLLRYRVRRNALEKRLCKIAAKAERVAARFAKVAAVFDEECGRYVRERGVYLDALAEIRRRVDEWKVFGRALVFGPKPKGPMPPRPVDVGVPPVPAGVSLRSRRAYGDAIADMAATSAALLVAWYELVELKRGSGSDLESLKAAACRLEKAADVFVREDGLMREASSSKSGAGR